MNAERNFLFACLIFALVIYAIHAFGLFDLLTDLPHLQTLIRTSCPRLSWFLPFPVLLSCSDPPLEFRF